MELDDFIYTSLTDIVKGIKKANDELNKVNSFVPSSNLVQYTRGESNIKAANDKNGKQHLVTDVNFDVAVTVAKGGKGGVNGGIKVYKIGKIGGFLSGLFSKNKVSKIQFSIPLALPPNSEEGE